MTKEPREALQQAALFTDTGWVTFLLKPFIVSWAQVAGLRPLCRCPSALEQLRRKHRPRECVVGSVARSKVFAAEFHVT